ncbi:MAG: hypothetical protein JW814_04710 [Candidatus Krumholzibacteriota bacterium]|nr:hypothetical protein [Candidatus Krumholzibacteriota bacterium]
MRGLFTFLVSSEMGLFLFLFGISFVLGQWRYWPLAGFVCFWAGTIIAVIYIGFRLWRLFRPIEYIAEDIGRSTGNGSLFAAALEFTGKEKRLGNYSPYLMKETARRGARRLETVSALEIFGGEGKPGWLISGSVLGVMMLAVVIFGNRDAAQLAGAILDPGLSFASSPANNLIVTEVDQTVLAGEDVTVGAVRMGSARGDVEIRFSTVPGVWKSFKTMTAAGPEGGNTFRSFTYQFREIREDVDYYFKAGGEKSASRHIAVMHRPVINVVEAVLEYPPYTGKVPDTLSFLSGKRSVLSGTKVLLSGEVSKSVMVAAAEFSSGERIDFKPAGKRFYGEFKVIKSDTMTLAVIDSAGLSNESSISYPFICRSDRPPAVEIFSPPDPDVLPRSLRTRVLFRAADDYGIVELNLRFMKEGRDSRFLSIDVKKGAGEAPRVIENDYEWSLEGERVFPGDRILYYMEARDNNSADQQGYARTETRVLTVPSLADLYVEARKEEQLRDRAFDEIVDESREIRDRMKELSDEFRATGKMDWESREKGKELLEMQERLKEKIQEAAGSLENTLREFEENRMTSMEIGKKIEEIQDLLKKIENEDLLEAMEKFQKMMRDIPDNEISDAMDEIDMQADDLAERLDRTIELLNRIMREEKMEELLRRMEDVIERQKEMRDETEKGDLERLAVKENELREEYNRLEKDLEEFSDRSAAEEKENATGEMIDDLKKSQIDSLMREAAAQMESDRRNEARSTENKTISEMLSLYTSLGRCQMSMNMAVDAEAVKAVEKAAWELVEVSKLSERFSGALGERNAPARLEYLLEEEAVIRDAIRKILAGILKAARMRLGISRDTFSHLSGALIDMESVIARTQDRRFGEAAGISTRVTAGLNRAVIELLKVSSASGGSGGSTGQKMENMLRGQTSIDKQLKEMAGGGEDSFSLESRARMSRMAAEQRKMEELLRQISKESYGTGEVLGRLDDIGDEMKEVAESLEDGKLDRDLIDREERILSRMLESNKSLKRRDYKRERISRTAENINAEKGGEIDGPGDDLDLLLEKIRKGMQEKGPVEYEELIQAYFRALSRKAREGAGR